MQDAKGLVISSVSFRYRPRDPDVISSISITVPPGKIHAVCGHNGAGKSTLLLLAAGWLKPDSGTVSIDGANPATAAPSLRRRLLVLLPQTVTPLYDLTAFDIISLGLPRPFPTNSPQVQSAIEEAATTLGLSLLNRKFQELSAGEKKKALIASCLVQKPRWLMLDEPTAELDPAAATTLMITLRRLVREGDLSGVLLATHDLNLASLYSDQVSVIRGGKILATGLPEHVLTIETLKSVFGARLDVTLHAPTGRPIVVPWLG